MLKLYNQETVVSIIFLCTVAMNNILLHTMHMSHRGMAEAKLNHTLLY